MVLGINSKPIQFQVELRKWWMDPEHGIATKHTSNDEQLQCHGEASTISPVSVSSVTVLLELHVNLLSFTKSNHNN